jgi:glycosyltransferase involved in cell wall biosynthesis
MDPQGVDISAVLTLHSEGLLAHRTLKSITRAMRYAQERGLVVELVIVLDSSDEATEAYLRRSPFARSAARILSTRFSDSGPARNAGIQEARGRFVAIFDGDDLWSENWIFRAHQLAHVNPRYVVHPEMQVTFGREGTGGILYNYQMDQQLTQVRLSSLLFANLWAIACVAPRQTFIDVPYAPTSEQSGFGYEDWHWNCELVAHGFIHKTAPRTALFYRSRQEGRCFQQVRANCIVRHSRLFDDIVTLSHPRSGDAE